MDESLQVAEEIRTRMEEIKAELERLADTAIAIQQKQVALQKEGLRLARLWKWLRLDGTDTI